MMLPDDPAKVRAQLAEVRAAYGDAAGVSPSPAHRADPAATPAPGDPPTFVLGQDQAAAEAAMAAAYRAEDARQAAASPAGGGDPGQAEADTSPLTKAPGDPT